MKQRLTVMLVCPVCRSGLTLSGEELNRWGAVEAGTLRCLHCGREYPIRETIPRFVPPDHYASTFGWQWNRFKRTQLDGFSGLNVSRDRFLTFTSWKPDDLKGKTILDLGCGAGRFSEIALSFGASLVAVDSSVAVDACRENLPRDSDLTVVQADIGRLPFRAGAFDYVFCFGVLQHTPNPKVFFMHVAEQVGLNGCLAVDAYPRLWRNYLWPKYWLRPFTRRIPRTRLFAMVRGMVRELLPASRGIGRFPGIGRQVRYLVPVANYEGVYPLSSKQLYEWALLDTFDMLSPRYDHPISQQEMNAWFLEAGFGNVEVFRRGFLVGRGRRIRR